jgi:hypothetical protein
MELDLAEVEMSHGVRRPQPLKGVHEHPDGDSH